MNKQIITEIGIIACIALCAAVWPRSAEVGDLPAEPVKTDVSAEIEARSEEMPRILFSTDTPAPEAEPIAGREPAGTQITTEKETKKPMSAQTAQQAKPPASSSEPHNGNVHIVDGEKQIYLLGFG